MTSETNKNDPFHKDSSFLTAVTYLNDDFDGGEICFPEQKVCIKPSPGSTIIFPSDFKHEVKEVLNKNRYMLSNSINMI